MPKAKWFATTWQAQIVINSWRRHYDDLQWQEALNIRMSALETTFRNFRKAVRLKGALHRPSNVHYRGQSRTCASRILLLSAMSVLINKRT